MHEFHRTHSIFMFGSAKSSLNLEAAKAAQIMVKSMSFIVSDLWRRTRLLYSGEMKTSVTKVVMQLNN